MYMAVIKLTLYSFLNNFKEALIMNFQLTKEQEFVKEMVRKFAVNEVEPLAAEIDQEHRFPEETVVKMARYGLMGIPFIYICITPYTPWDKLV